jgi:hypothetical protein
VLTAKAGANSAQRVDALKRSGYTLSSQQFREENLMFQRICTYAILGASVYLGGCASIVNGQNQPVSIDTRNDSGVVSGANCKLSNNKGTWFVTTPGTTTVQRSFEDLAVHCTKDTQEPGFASVKSSTKAMAFGNILFGGPIGAAVDVGTGAAYDYPSLITVLMGKTSTIAPPAPAAAAPSAAAAGTASR